ncbi:MAG: ABC transporter permease [Sporolactobacillus sp.]
MLNKTNRAVYMVPYILWIFLFVLAPLAMILYYSFFNLQGQLTLENYRHFFTSIYLQMALASLWYAFLITLFTLLIAYPAAYVLTLLKHSQLWLLLFILPTWINVLLKAYAFIGLLGTFGPVNALFHTLGLGRQQLLFNGSSFVFVSVYLFIPFMILPIFNSLEKLDQSFVDAAHDLGASQFATFRRVIFPLTLDGVKSGIQAVFIPALSLFMLTRLIAGNKVITLGTAIEEHFLVTQDWGMGATIAVFLILAMVLVMAVMGRGGRA